MQNVGQEPSRENRKLERVSAQELGKSGECGEASPSKTEQERFSGLQPRYMTDSSLDDEDDVSEVESYIIEQARLEHSRAVTSLEFMLNQEDGEQSVDPETQARLEALLEAAGIGKLHTGDGKQLADPEVLRRLTSSVSCALDEAAAALTRMRTENTRQQPPERTLVEACSDGDVGTVKKLLTEGRSVHETTEEGESLLSLACSAGYYELAQVLLAMHANVEDRGIKGDCTPLMEAASSGYAEIVKLLIHHRADVNAQSTSGNTPLMYACAGGHNEVVKILLDAGANVEDHNENGHTPLMEAASAGHVNVAATLLERGAGINTHSNEFKESALTLACYKGHLDMVRFLLGAGADQEHKTDEMHTALMEASMDGHVEVAKLLLDSGAQVNMPTDSFESPLTLAACGGHVDLALLLIERGANIEEVNDEGYTPLMEAAREGHDEMVKLLLSKGANINAQTEETQETALTLACCGGFLDVADYLIQQGAEIELGASTPLMEAAQEGHLDLVRYLVEHNANVNAQTQTGDTALTYSCENGHTEVARLLLEYGANLEHESEGGRTPLMKACRAGHLNTVKFLLSRQANVNKQTANNDHTPLSLAAAGGHIAVVELLLAHQADPFHKLKDNSTMLIEAAKGGHTNVVQLLLDFPHSIMMSGSAGANPECSNTAPSSPTAVTPPDSFSLESLSVLPPPPPVLPPPLTPPPPQPSELKPSPVVQQAQQPQKSSLSSLRKQLSLALEALSPQETQQLSKQQECVNGGPILGTGVSEGCREDALDKGGTSNLKSHHLMIDPQYYQRQQIVQELQRVEEELKEKGGVSLVTDAVPLSPASSPSLVDFFPSPSSPHSALTQEGSVVDILCDSMTACDGDMVYHGAPLIVHDPALVGRDPGLVTCDPGLFAIDPGVMVSRDQPHTPPPSMVPLPPGISNVSAITLPSEVVQSTAISDRPKAKPAWKKEGKNARKQTAAAAAFQAALQHQALAHITDQHLAQALGQQVGSVQTEVNDDMILAALSESPPSTKQPPGVLTTHIMARVQQQLDYAVAQVSPSNNDPRNTLADMSGCGSKYHVGEVSVPPEPDASLFVSRTKQPTNNKQETFDSDKFDTDFRTHVNQLVNLASTATNEEKMNFHKAVLKNLQKAAVEKGLMPVGPPLFVDEQTTMSQGVVPVPQPPLHPYTPSTQGNTFNEMGREEGKVGSNRMCRPSLVTPPPPPPSQPPPSAALLLKTPPPPSCDCHGASKVSEGMKEQVQAGTQTSPALLPSLDSKDQSPAAAVSSTTKSGKKARYHHQKSTQAPSPNVHQPSYPGSECGVSSTSVAATPSFSCMDVDSATDSNNDTALTLACAGGHEELVELLLSRGANIEHRDKKGFTPLILAATAGHEKVVEILLNHSADMEAQSERTKDTPLSLACSGGRYEVVELLLQRGANKEHRNVSDYTPLSLAASGGYVNIIKLLLSHGAEINSRTGSKLGISPLMLAAMNGHTAAVKLLLDMGSDINAQIETNRNTALTLACFQGRHEVVSLLLDRKANVEHRAKTGLTPLMEAASGGYVEVGRVLLDKGADVNAPPVPSSRDTALTIAADKGHVRFVELLLSRNAQVEVKNKKGNSPLWLAANGGHLAVVELLYSMGADIDSQDNRKVSCLMAAFRKGHVKVVKWMVNHVNQFPSDQEMTRYISTLSDKLLDKCHECTKNIRIAKDQQAAKANKNASILLEELYMEKTREESRRAAAARRRERKKKKKLEKRKAQEEMRELEEGPDDDEEQDPPVPPNIADVRDVKGTGVGGGGAASPRGLVQGEVEEGDSGIDANSQGSCSSTEQVKPLDPNSKKKDRKKKKNNPTPASSTSTGQPQSHSSTTTPSILPVTTVIHSSCAQLNSNDKRNNSNNNSSSSVKTSNNLKTVIEGKAEKSSSEMTNKVRQHNTKNSSSNVSDIASGSGSVSNVVKPPPLVFEARHPADRDDFESTGTDNHNKKNKNSNNNNYMMYCEEMMQSAKGAGSSTSPKQGGKREEPWKEVVRKFVCTYRSKKVSVPLNAISRVIGRGGSNINAIRTATGAHIEVEKQGKGQGERTITLKGSTEATKQAHTLITALIKDPEVDILTLLPKSAKSAAAVWEKSVNTAKSKPGVSNKTSLAPSTTTMTTPKTTTFITVKRSTGGSSVKEGGLQQGGIPSQSSTKTIMSYTGAIMTCSKQQMQQSNVISGTCSSSGTVSQPPLIKPLASLQTQAQTFAAKLSDCNRSVTPTSNLVGSTGSTVQPFVQQPVVSIAPLLGTTVVPPPSVTATIPTALPPELPPVEQVSQPLKPVERVATPPPPPHTSIPVAPPPVPPLVSSVVIPPQEVAVGSATSNSCSIAESQVTSHSTVSSNSTPGRAPPVVQPSAHTPTPTQCRTPTPPAPLSSPQAPSQPTATFEYSLFNDNFTKVAQQMWGQRENLSAKPGVCIEKGMNFASVAATNAVGPPVVQPPKYLEPAPPPPQVDASKAPGYRASPVAKSQSSLQTNPSSVANNIVVTSGNNVTNNYFPEVVMNHPVSSGNTAFRPVYQQDSVDIIQHTFQPPHVSMSRLNPRAPDFSSSFKQGMYNYVPAGTLVGPPPPVPFTPAAAAAAKFPRPPPTPANGRWHIPPTYLQMEMLACAAQVDMSLQENGNGGEDRKPRPIGTERSAWKNNLYTSGGAEEPWTLDQGGAKLSWVDRSHLYRQAQQIPFPSAPRLQHLQPPQHQPDDFIDQAYQNAAVAAAAAGLENAATGALGGFGGGGGSGGGLLAGGATLQHYTGAPELHHAAPQDLQCWPQPPVHQPQDLTPAPPPHQTDKHGWAAKWNH